MRAPALLSFVVVASAAGAPPTLEIPAEVKPANGYAMVTPKGDVKTVTYIGLDGVYPFPSGLLADKRLFALPVQGLAPGRYRFVAVGSLNDEHAVAEFAVVISGPTPPPVPPTPTPPGPVPPPDVPPLPPDNPPEGKAPFPGVRAESRAMPHKQRIALAVAHRRVAGSLAKDGPVTVKEIRADLNAEITALQVEGVPPGLAKLCSSILGAADSHGENEALPPESVKSIQAALKRIAESLEAP